MNPSMIASKLWDAARNTVDLLAYENGDDPYYPGVYSRMEKMLERSGKNQTQSKHEDATGLYSARDSDPMDESSNEQNIADTTDMGLRIDSVFTLSMDSYLTQNDDQVSQPMEKLINGINAETQVKTKLNESLYKPCPVVLDTKQYPTTMVKTITDIYETKTKESLGTPVSESTGMTIEREIKANLHESRCKPCSVVLLKIDHDLAGRNRVFYRQWKRRFDKCGHVCRQKYIDSIHMRYKRTEKKKKRKRKKHDKLKREEAPMPLIDNVIFRKETQERERGERDSKEREIKEREEREDKERDKIKIHFPKTRTMIKEVKCKNKMSQFQPFSWRPQHKPKSVMDQHCVITPATTTALGHSTDALVARKGKGHCYPHILKPSVDQHCVTKSLTATTTSGHQCLTDTLQKVKTKIDQYYHSNEKLVEKTKDVSRQERKKTNESLVKKSEEFRHKKKQEKSATEFSLANVKIEPGLETPAESKKVKSQTPPVPTNVKVKIEPGLEKQTPDYSSLLNSKALQQYTAIKELLNVQSEELKSSTSKIAIPREKPKISQTNTTVKYGSLNPVVSSGDRVLSTRFPTPTTTSVPNINLPVSYAANQRTMPVNLNPNTISFVPGTQNLQTQPNLMSVLQNSQLVMSNGTPQLVQAQPSLQVPQQQQQPPFQLLLTGANQPAGQAQLVLTNLHRPTVTQNPSQLVVTNTNPQPTSQQLLLTSTNPQGSPQFVMAAPSQGLPVVSQSSQPQFVFTNTNPPTTNPTLAYANTARAITKKLETNTGVLQTAQQLVLNQMLPQIQQQQQQHKVFTLPQCVPQRMPQRAPQRAPQQIQMPSVVGSIIPPASQDAIPVIQTRSVLPNTMNFPPGTLFLKRNSLPSDVPQTLSSPVSTTQLNDLLRQKLLSPATKSNPVKSVQLADEPVIMNPSIGTKTIMVGNQKYLLVPTIAPADVIGQQDTATGALPSQVQNSDISSSTASKQVEKVSAKTVPLNSIPAVLQKDGDLPADTRSGYCLKRHSIPTRVGNFIYNYEGSGMQRTGYFDQTPPTNATSRPERYSRETKSQTVTATTPKTTTTTFPPYVTGTESTRNVTKSTGHVSVTANTQNTTSPQTKNTQIATPPQTKNTPNTSPPQPYDSRTVDDNDVIVIEDGDTNSTNFVHGLSESSRKRVPRKSKPQARLDFDETMSSKLQRPNSRKRVRPMYLSDESDSEVDVESVSEITGQGMLIPKTPTMPPGVRQWPDGATIQEKRVTLPPNILQELEGSAVSGWCKNF